MLLRDDDAIAWMVLIAIAIKFVKMGKICRTI